MPFRSGCVLCDSSLWLLLAIAASWVGVAQLARSAEKMNAAVQPASIVHLMTWANATAWICLAIPHMLRKWREPEAEKIGMHSKLISALTSDVFQCTHAFQFLALALVTNYAYIGALHYLAASLNTAIFCSSPVFTLLFSIVWLSPTNLGEAPVSLCSRLVSWEGLAVMLSVLGVMCIAEPWQMLAGHSNTSSRLAGVGLSIFAALGTATYQVYFKRTFGDKMKADEVGLFLAYMGLLIFIIFGAVLATSFRFGVYPLDLTKVPWGAVVSTSVCSALFNFLIKFGLSRDTPVAVSLATQIGIPLNLLVDVLIVHAHFDACQVIGTLVMLVAFSLQRSPPRSPDDAEAAKIASGSNASEPLADKSV